MTDPVALLSEHLRIDTSNPPGDSRRAAVLAVHPDAAVVPNMSASPTHVSSGRSASPRTD